jgi:hypothetical protein
MTRPAAILAVAVFGSARALTAQTDAPDPWKKIPSLQTTCYVDHDFTGKLHSAYEDIGADLSRQREINEALSKKLQDLGPQEITQRMIAYMQRDPQKAMKMMEAQQAAATQVTSGITSGDDAKKERDAEFAQLSAAFNAEMDAGAKPFRARRDEIMKTSRRPESFDGGGLFTTKAAENEFNDQVSKESADYEARCAAYFGANGKIHKWLARYRETVLDPVAKSTEAHDEIGATQLAILDSPGIGFRSTAQMKAAREFLLVAEKAYALRRVKMKDSNGR